VTVRESKRPKAQTQDDEYKRRSSVSPSMHPISALYPTRESPKRDELGNEPRGDTPTTRSGQGTLPQRLPPDPEEKGGFGESRGIGSDNGGGNSPGSNAGRDVLSTLIGHAASAGNLPGGVDEFDINLIYEGASRRHRFFQHMLVDQLAHEASGIFRLIADELVMVLFGMLPQTLLRANRISDPPRVGLGATVMIFSIAGGARRSGGNPVASGGYSSGRDDGFAQASFSDELAGSKILGNFKLPKFDGNARYWKTWESVTYQFTNSIL
jgi:hypothetical protein